MDRPGMPTAIDSDRGLSPAPDTDPFSRQLLAAMLAFRNGSFATRMPTDLIGVQGRIADTFNEIVTISERRALETARVSRTGGSIGKLKQRMPVPGLAGDRGDEQAARSHLTDD